MNGEEGYELARRSVWNTVACIVRRWNGRYIARHAATVHQCSVRPHESGASRNRDACADSRSSGPATAIVVNDTAYLIDFGPGVVRRASAAATSKGIAALQPTRLRVAFVTHLHSDHTVGYPDLILTPWALGRRAPLEVFGPKGLKPMTERLLEAYGIDIETRTNSDGNQRTFADGHKVNAHEIVAGPVYRDANVSVTAFATKHAMESYGYRFDTADRSVVVSGDTNPTQATIDACRGCDVLIHEVHTPAWLDARPDHDNSLSPEELQADMMKHYSGRFVIGRDLDVY